MAPEVFRREKYGKTVDLYSLGLVMYWLLNRYRMPFVPLGEAITPDLMMSAENRRASGEALDAPCDASPELSKIILKACAFRSDEQKNHSEIHDKTFPILPHNRLLYCYKLSSFSVCSACRSAAQHIRCRNGLLIHR